MGTGEIIFFIGLGIILVILAVIAVWFLLSNAKRNRGAPTKQAEVEAQPEPIPQKDASIKEIVLLQRDEGTGRIAIQIDKTRFVDPAQIDEAKRRELQIVARELFQWLSLKVEESKPEPQPISPPVRAVERIPTPFPASAEEKSDEGIIPGTKVETTGVSTVQATIIGQIDAILQELLSKSEVAYPPVKIVEDPRRGVVVWIGLNSFDGIESVTDSGIKELLQKAVTEWERRDEFQRRKQK